MFCLRMCAMICCVFVRRMRHPNIMLLLGVCQTEMLEGLALIYERVGLGSLHYYLHHTVSVHLIHGFSAAVLPYLVK